MIRLLAALGAILAMVFAMDRALATALGEVLRHSADRFISVYRPGEPASVVILGNSRADNHFPAADIGGIVCGTALNLGMGGAPTTVSDLLWHDYVERHGPPRLLLIEPTNVVDNPLALSDVPLLSYYSRRVDAFVRTVDATMWTSNRVFNTLVFNSNQTIRLALGMLHPTADRTLTGSLSPELKAQMEAAPEETMAGHPPNWEALDRIVATARAHGTRVAVVVAPYHPTYLRRVTNIDAFFEELKRRLPAGVPVIDARRTVEGDENFVDALHINQDGVRLMLAGIEERIRALGNCPPDAVAQLGGRTAGSVLANP